MADLIRGKVARVLNSREIAINLGWDDGVEAGMYFNVLDQKSEDVTDPDTGKLLGSVERPKVGVKVIDVQEKLSVAATYKVKKVNVGGQGPSYSAISQMFMPPKWITKFETLKTEEQTWEDLDEKSSYVKVGDPVIQVIPIEKESMD